MSYEKKTETVNCYEDQHSDPLCPPIPMLALGSGNMKHFCDSLPEGITLWLDGGYFCITSK